MQWSLGKGLLCKLRFSTAAISNYHEPALLQQYAICNKQYAAICNMQYAAIWNYHEALLQLWRMRAGSHTVNVNNITNICPIRICPKLAEREGKERCDHPLWSNEVMTSADNIITCDHITIWPHVTILSNCDHIEVAVGQCGTKSSSLRISRRLKIIGPQISASLGNYFQGKCTFQRAHFWERQHWGFLEFFVWLGISFCCLYRWRQPWGVGGGGPLVTLVTRTRPTVGPILVQSRPLVHVGVLLVFCMHQTRLLVLRMHQTRLLVFCMRQGDADVPRGELTAGKAVPGGKKALVKKCLVRIFFNYY